MVNRLRFLVSLITNDNDYQRQQASAAEIAARRLGVDAQIVYASNNAITQVQQLLDAIQSEHPPDAILCEPVGTGASQVARAAVGAGIGWAILNREADYIHSLREKGRAPIFSVSANQIQVGRIQGFQLSGLLPQGGKVLYLEGPGNTSVAQQRETGMLQTKNDAIEVRKLKGKWTEESAYNVVRSWLALSTSRQLDIGVIAAQNDAMAMGARKAFENNTAGADCERWLRLPYLGCDGCSDTGRAWVDKGLLAATVVIPANTDVAMEKMIEALEGSGQAEDLMTMPVSYPALDVQHRSVE
jgi:ribose transport system substrate-binding protein